MRVKDEAKIREIYNKAIELIATRGLDAFSMQSLAKAAKVSPATLYIYYKDKDDLIIQVCAEAHRRMADITLNGFRPDMHLAEGLKVQWKNRVKFYIENPFALNFTEQIKHTPYHQKCMALIDDTFRNAMMDFVKVNRERGELIEIPVEIYWSVAYAPLYQLLKYHIQGRSFPGMRPFKLEEKTLLATLNLVLKALKP